MTMTAIMSVQVVAFSPQTISTRSPHVTVVVERITNLNYKNFDDVIEVDEAVLDASRQKTTTASKSRAASRAIQTESPITSLHSLSDYQRHVLNEPHKLVLTRFHAPWCKVCQTTTVAFERMASKLSKIDSCSNDNSTGKGIKFLSVNLDGRDETCEKNQLKELLNIEVVPQGILFHPSVGVIGKVTLNRSNLSELKKRLERYLEDDVDLNGKKEFETLLVGLSEEKLEEMNLST